jgi:hypothetical protein
MGKLSSGEHAVIYLVVPAGKTIVDTGYVSRWHGQDPRGATAPLIRFGDFTVTKIIPVNRPSQFELTARSFRDPKFVYKVGQKYSVKLDTTSQKGQGCHGFVCPEGEAVVRLWPTMFGKS